MFDLAEIFGKAKKLFSRRDILLILALITAYFLTRLINLEKFPIFTDEGIYIHWAKVAWKDASWRFISLTDGKQPLQTWATIPFLKLFPENPLLAGRLFSVTSGFTSLIGIFTLIYYLFGKKAAYWGSFFYVLTPYFLFYDRMALVDSTVNSGFIWILFFSILLVRTLRFDVALIFGLVSGMSLLAKSSIRLFVGLSSLAPILVLEKNLKKFIKKSINFLTLYLVGFSISLAIYNIQRLSPFLHFVEEKNKTFVLTFQEFLKSPFQLFFTNLWLIPKYILAESAFILPLLGLAGLFILFKKDRRLAIYLFLWFILPFLAISFFAKVIFPRYLIFFPTLFLITASYLLIQLKNKAVVKFILIIYLLSVSYYSYTIVANHANIPFPSNDRGQYIESKNAGWGVAEIIDYARQKSQEKPVILIAEGNFGLVADMLDSSLKQSDKNISIRGYWPLDEKSLAENQKELNKNYVYVVFSHRSEFPTEWPIRLIKKFDKPGNRSAFYLFELLQ